MNTLLLLLPLFAPAPQREVPPAPDEKVVVAALEELDKAFDQKEVAPKVQVLERVARIVDVRIAREVAKSLGDKEPEIQRAAIEALRVMPLKESREALEKSLARDKKLRKDPEAFTAVVRAIGQHGSPESIELLRKDVFAVTDKGAVRARLMALGNIRDAKSVEALMGLMKSAGRQKVQPIMDDFRLALMILTGVDRGKSQDDWMSWWNDHKRDLEVRPEPQLLPEGMQKRWDSFWGNPRKYERSKKRGERGQDPENGSEE